MPPAEHPGTDGDRLPPAAGGHREAPAKDAPSRPRRRSSASGLRLGAALIRRRTELGLTRRQLAERAGLSYPFVSELERDAKSPSSNSLLALAEALDLSVAELITAGETPASSPSSPPSDSRSGQESEPSSAARSSVRDRLRNLQEVDDDLSQLASFVRDVVRDELSAELLDPANDVPGHDRTIDVRDSPGPRPQPPGAEEDRSTDGDLAYRVLMATRQMLDDDTVTLDRDGDIPVPHGGEPGSPEVTVFVRAMSDPDSVLVFCPVLVEVPSSAGLLRRLNDINEGVRFVRFGHIDDSVVVDLETFALHVDEELVAWACRAVGGAAAHFGPEMHEAFGGRRPFGDRASTAPRAPTAGYL